MKEAKTIVNMTIFISVMEALKTLKAARMATEMAQILKKDAVEKHKGAARASNAMWLRITQGVSHGGADEKWAYNEHEQLAKKAISLEAAMLAAEVAWNAALSTEEAAAVAFMEAVAAVETLNVHKAESVIAQPRSRGCWWWLTSSEMSMILE